MGPNFEEKFATTYGSHKQCMRSTVLDANALKLNLAQFKRSVRKGQSNSGSIYIEREKIYQSLNNKYKVDFGVPEGANYYVGCRVRLHN